MAAIDDIKAAIEPLGYPIYAPGQYEGRCRAPYIVVTLSGIERAGRKGIQGFKLIDIIEYVPVGNYQALWDMHEKVMEALCAALRQPDSVSGDAIESDYRAHTRTITYRIAATFD